MSNHLSTRSAHSQHTSIDHLLSSSIISSFMCPRKRNSTTTEIGSHTGNSNKVPAFHGIICWSAPRQPCKVMVYLASIRESIISIPFHSCFNFDGKSLFQPRWLPSCCLQASPAVPTAHAKKMWSRATNSKSPRLQLALSLSLRARPALSSPSTQLLSVSATFLGFPTHHSKDNAENTLLSFHADSKTG